MEIPPAKMLGQVLAYQTLGARLRSELRWEKERRHSCDEETRGVSRVSLRVPNRSIHYDPLLIRL